MPAVAMSDPPRSLEMPRTVRIAAALLALYGIAVLVNATVLQQMSGWQDAGDYPRGVIRCAGMLLVAWGLMKGARWAWWVGVLLPSFWLVLLVGGLITLASLGADAWAAGLPPGFFPFAIGSAVALSAAVVLLLLRESRAAVLHDRV